MEVGGGPVYSVILEVFSKSFLCCSAEPFPGHPWIRKLVGVCGKGRFSLYPLAFLMCWLLQRHLSNIWDKTKTYRSDHYVGPRKPRPPGISLVVQCLRICASIAGGVGQSLAGLLRSHTPWTQPKGFKKLRSLASLPSLHLSESS